MSDTSNDDDWVEGRAVDGDGTSAASSSRDDAATLARASSSENDVLVNRVPQSSRKVPVPAAAGLRPLASPTTGRPRPAIRPSVPKQAVVPPPRPPASAPPIAPRPTIADRENEETLTGNQPPALGSDPASSDNTAVLPNLSVDSQAPRRPPPIEAMALNRGDIVGGTCRIEERLASSEMSVLYRAFHVGLERMVVVKILHDAVVENAEAVARFRREARLMSRMKSDHTAKVLDVGTHEGSPFIVMELLEGADLAYLMKQVGSLSLKQASDLVLQICEALAVAHAHGIVHRDLKPGNVFVSVLAGGALRVTIIDFGIAKAFARREGNGGGDSDDVTRTSSLLGSPRYMAPEQVAQHSHIDERADIWALGILFQEILTGQRVFDADNVVSMLMAIVEKAPIPLRRYMPDAPDEICATIESALVKDRAQRLPNILTFAARVAPFASADAIQRLAAIAAILTPSTTDDPESINVPASARSVTTAPPSAPSADDRTETKVAPLRISNGPDLAAPPSIIPVMAPPPGGWGEPALPQLTTSLISFQPKQHAITHTLIAAPGRPVAYAPPPSRLHTLVFFFALVVTGALLAMGIGWLVR